MMAVKKAKTIVILTISCPENPTDLKTTISESEEILPTATKTAINMVNGSMIKAIDGIE